jgi:hypothetical protein
MTYKEIINRFRTITTDHLMLEDFGYGDLSDLKYVSQIGDEEERVQYPYLYLLPSSSTRNGVVMNYSFNMIVMDMARPEDGPNTDKYDNYITIQSQCQQYIDDVLAQLYYFYKDQPEIQLTGITYTPFKEKYQDVVAGMTATINIAVPTPLNECIAPFRNIIAEYSFNPVLSAEPDPIGQGVGTRAPTEIGMEFFYDPNLPAYPYRAIYVPQTGTWQVAITGVVTQEEAKPLGKPISLEVYKMDSTGIIAQLFNNLAPTTVSGWNQGQSVKEDFTFTAQYGFTTGALEPGETIAILYGYQSATADDESSIKIPSSKIIISIE